MLYLYFTEPTIVETPFAVAPHPTKPQPCEEIFPTIPATSDDPRLWSYRRLILTENIDDLPPTLPESDTIAPEPVWTVGTFASVSAVN